MNAQLSTLNITSQSRQSGEENLWLPQRRLLRYQFAKICTALIVLNIFTGWMIIEWTNLGVRILTIVLGLITAGVTIASVTMEVRRYRGRQLQIQPGILSITAPGTRTQVAISNVACGQWRDGPPDRGLWLYGQHGQILAHLDKNFLADQHEAYAFLGWARRHTKLAFEVKWPRAENV